MDHRLIEKIHDLIEISTTDLLFLLENLIEENEKMTNHLSSIHENWPVDKRPILLKKLTNTVDSQRKRLEQRLNFIRTSSVCYFVFAKTHE